MVSLEQPGQEAMVSTFIAWLTEKRLVAQRLERLDAVDAEALGFAGDGGDGEHLRNVRPGVGREAAVEAPARDVGAGQAVERLLHPRRTRVGTASTSSQRPNWS